MKVSVKNLENQIVHNIRKIIPEENLKINEPMSKHTSFKVGGEANYFITAKSEEEVKQTIKFAHEQNIPLYVIGNGSNLLVKDEGYKGIILKIAIENLQIEEQVETIIVHVGAGYKVMALAQVLRQKEITGFEELSGIPGTIGGANYMNAGAYGKEMKDIIVETKVLNKDTMQIQIIPNNEQELEYRSSIFKDDKYIILETTLRLGKGKVEEITERMNEYLKSRKEKQPVEYPSAGSTFKRGKDYITAQLIDKAGLKGYSVGGAQISEKHAGFIINKGNATAKDIIDLIEYTKKKVFEKFGVVIEEEIKII